MNIELDLHGLSLQEAIMKIQKTIVANPNCKCIEAIHGYNNGTKLKDALANKKNIHNSRVIKTIPNPYNNGRTNIILKIN